MRLTTLSNALAAGSFLVSSASSAAVTTESRTPSKKQSDYEKGFPVPNPTKSYWQDPPHRIADLRSTPDLPTDQTFDYVIIGSGVSGAATAFKLLSRNPDLSVLMLEARTAASGASGRNGGHCKTGDYKNIAKWIDLYGEDEALKIGKLEQDCVDDMRHFVHKYNVSSGWEDVETADVYYTKEAFEEAIEIVELQRTLEERRPDDVPQNNPRTIYRGQAARDYWRWPEILGAVTSTGHTQNPYLTVCAMLELGLDMGLQLQTHTMAQKLTPVTGPEDGSRRWEVTTERGTVKGKQVVLATNGFTPALHPGFAATGFLEPGRSQATALHPSANTSTNPAFLARSNTYSDFPAGGDYIIARAPGDYPGAGDVVYGGGQSFSPTRERNITDDSVVNEAIANYLHGVARVTYGHANWGETTSVQADWVGITCYTPDGLPVVGAVPGDDGLWASVCMNGHGMAWAFRSAEALVEMMMEGEAPEWFPQPFRADRAWEVRE